MAASNILDKVRYVEELYEAIQKLRDGKYSCYGFCPSDCQELITRLKGELVLTLRGLAKMDKELKK